MCSRGCGALALRACFRPGEAGHAAQVDPAIPESTGYSFAPNSSLHGWTFDVEGVTGFAVAVRPCRTPVASAAALPARAPSEGVGLQGSKGYQTAHLVRRTDVFYSALWLNATSAEGGLWLPTFWARSRFELLDSAAGGLRNAIQVTSSLLHVAYMTSMQPLPRLK